MSDQRSPAQPGSAVVELALLAVAAAQHGDVTAAREHIARAGRPSARRHRQALEIARLAASGCLGRATGLAVEHAAEFPEDAGLLAQVTGGRCGGIARPDSAPR